MTSTRYGLVIGAWLLALTSNGQEPTPQERVDRIIENSEGAAQRMEQKDLGDQTRKLHADILADIDALIKQAEQPPPMPMPMPPMPSPPDGPPMPMPMPQPGGAGGEDQEPMPMPNTGGPVRPAPKPEPKPGRTETRPSGGEPGQAKPVGGASGGLDEFDRGAWGHLPEKMRRDIDTYYRDRFMPQYDDLLREYYSAVAEAGRR